MAIVANCSRQHNRIRQIPNVALKAMTANSICAAIKARNAVVGPCVCVNDPKWSGNRNSSSTVKMSTQPSFRE